MKRFFLILTTLGLGIGLWPAAETESVAQAPPPRLARADGTPATSRVPRSISPVRAAVPSPPLAASPPRGQVGVSPPVVPRSDTALTVIRPIRPRRPGPAGPGEPGRPMASHWSWGCPRVTRGRSAGQSDPVEGGQSLSLQAALYGALTSNPDLVSLRAGNVPGNAASPEAVEVARRFPTTSTRLSGSTSARGDSNGCPARRCRMAAASDRARSQRCPDVFFASTTGRDWATRRATATRSPWPRSTSSVGRSSRPSCSPSSRPTASSRPPPTVARS